MENIRSEITDILLEIAKDPRRDEKDRLKACEALMRMAQGQGEEGGENGPLRVVVEYGRGGAGGDNIGGDDCGQ